MERILTFGASGDKLGGINSFLINMNKNMTENCVFDYVIEGPNSVNHAQIEEAGGREYHTAYFRESPLKKIFQTYSFLKECKQDHHVAYFNLFSMVHILEALQAKHIGYKVVLHAHNNDIENKSRLYRVLHNINRFLFRKVDCVRLTNSSLSTEFMFGKEHNRDTIMIYNAIDPSMFQFNDIIRSKKRKELGIQDKLVVGFSGRLQLQKNPLFLIDVFDEIYKRKPEAILLIAGEGYLREKILERIAEKKLDDRVFLLGNRRDMADLYQAMDLFLLPSKFEGLGIVLIEAQCSGVPSVTSADVVPAEAQVTNLLTYIPLSCSAKEWADLCLEKINMNSDRSVYSHIIEASHFNISKEAKRLEAILCGCGGSSIEQQR